MKTIIPLYLLISFSVACSPALISGIQEKEFVSDGLDKDWPAKMYHNQKSGLTYAITHDHAYLYVFIEVEAQSTQLKILVNGMKLWIDSEGGKRSDKGVQFPIGQAKAPAANLEYLNLSQTDLMALQHKVLAEMNQLELIGINGKGTIVWRELKEQDDLVFRIGFDREARLLYEARIPFDSYFNLQKGQTISLGIETGSFDRPNQIEDLSGRPGQSEGYQTQRRVMALSELTIPTELWLKKVKLGD